MQTQIGVAELCAVIRDRIERSPQRRLTFCSFMELALYHPQHGYYTTSASQLGKSGDFVTSAHLGNDFAELLAEQLVDLWRRLGMPQAFHWVEMGAGQGLLAHTILTYLHERHPDCLAALHYTLIETSPALRSAQQQRLESWRIQGFDIRWSTWEEIPQETITGCVFSNELVDAFPVHRVTVTENGLQEDYVTLSEDPSRPFKSLLGPLSTSRLTAYFDALDIQIASPPYPQGYTTEVNLAALDWMTQVAQKLQQGYVLTIDYGYSADRYYSPLRSQGTLQCYTQHAHHNDPFINIGQQDITAHVDFTTLSRRGEQCGLETLGNVPQELFLMALGLGDRLNELAQLQGTDSATVNYAIRRRQALHQLMNPLGLGKFSVLVQGKGLATEAQRQLKGLTVPPLV
ncbi:class I SAM-dependent methyltransferase [Oscillatoria sp. CS-180]|uniref:class I SAM-dependent methyltransferase n=1 Tax=Oscillatoria sp. CS-180 TaxID=3021720 RepID=UPI00232B6CA5|nr:class I SAM-dependent methyltransferase [Oscillatoria sp. CS-180]MDB9528598.1 class I SAM-dependent methyltransferase [Oscillatoria sp. CS-180]